MSVGLREIGEYWSIDDIADAHDALDLRDELRAKANAAEE